MRVRAAVALASLLAGVVVIVASPASAGVVIDVPVSQPTIQAGIDAASNGDTVVVAPGTYFEHIDFKGKAIEMRSSAGPATTVINGGGLLNGVTFKSGETRAAVLRGFTVTGGAGALYGVGVLIENSSPTVVDNNITGNVAPSGSGAGIGIAIQVGSPLIERNQIVDNPEGSIGGGIYAVNGSPEIVGNLIQGHSASFGAGVHLSGGTLRDNVIRDNHAGSFAGGVGADRPVSLLNNLIVDNSAVNLAGGFGWAAPSGQTATFANNTLAGNQAPTGSALVIASAGLQLINNVLSGSSAASAVSCLNDGPGGTVFSHNDVYNGTASPYAGCANTTGTNGNVSADPLLAADHRLLAGSPAIDAGAAGPSVPATDRAGNPRPTDGDGDGVAVVDMGAFEAPAVPVPTSHPLAPARILDTRSGNGAAVAKLGPNGTLSLQVTGRGGVPATGVASVVLNVTVTDTASGGFLTAWPAGADRPLASNLNYAAGDTVPNLVVVKVGAGGAVNPYSSGGPVDVIADVAGWFTT